MIQKHIIFRPPWGEVSVVQLELLLSRFARESVRVKTGAYIGDGGDRRVIDVGARPLLVLIQRGQAGAGDMVFAIRNDAGISYLPSSGFVSDAVVSFDPQGFTVGSNTDVNTAAVSYNYLVLL